MDSTSTVNPIRVRTHLAALILLAFSERCAGAIDPPKCTVVRGLRLNSTSLFSYPGVGDLDACCVLCSAYTNCTAWTLSNGTAPTCFLMAGLSAQIPDASFTSGFTPNAATHFSDPRSGCLHDEIVNTVPTMDGSFCSPPCRLDNTWCPADVPAGVTATPACMVSDPVSMPSKPGRHCALHCVSDADCGVGVCSLMYGPSNGVCIYPPPSSPPPVAVAGELRLVYGTACPAGWVEKTETKGYLLAGAPINETGGLNNAEPPLSKGEVGRVGPHSHDATAKDPGHTHAATTKDPGHAHVAAVSDPGHTHTTMVNDPGHAHGVQDPGHSHGVLGSKHSCAKFNQSNCYDDPVLPGLRCWGYEDDTCPVRYSTGCCYQTQDFSPPKYYGDSYLKFNGPGEFYYYPSILSKQSCSKGGYYRADSAGVSTSWKPYPDMSVCTNAHLTAGLCHCNTSQPVIHQKVPGNNGIDAPFVPNTNPFAAPSTSKVSLGSSETKVGVTNAVSPTGVHIINTQNTTGITVTNAQSTTAVTVNVSSTSGPAYPIAYVLVCEKQAVPNRKSRLLHRYKALVETSED